MDRDSVLALAAGFLLGFIITNLWVSQTAPDRFRVPENTGISKPSGPAAVDLKRIQQLLEEVQKNPENFEALVELGNLNYDQKNFEDAISWYRKALEIRPNEITIRTDLATSFFYARRFDDAISEFQNSLAVNPTHPETLFNMGVTLLHGKNDPKGALELWEKLVATNPDYPQLPIVKGRIDAIKKQVK